MGALPALVNDGYLQLEDTARHQPPLLSSSIFGHKLAVSRCMHIHVHARARTCTCTCAFGYRLDPYGCRLGPYGCRLGPYGCRLGPYGCR